VLAGLLGQLIYLRRRVKTRAVSKKGRLIAIRGILRLGMGSGRIEELTIGKLTVDKLVLKCRSVEP
jgi:hypothetical protein